MAGNGLRASECSDSIMQLARLRARSAVSVARQSGTLTKRLEDRSKDWRVLASGASDVALIEVRELSASERCRRNRHMKEGRMPRDRRLDEELRSRNGSRREPRLEFELPDPDRLIVLSPPPLRTW